MGEGGGGEGGGATSNVFRYTHRFFLHYQLREGFVPRVGCSLLVQLFEPLRLCKQKHWVIDNCCIETMLS